MKRSRSGDSNLLEAFFPVLHDAASRQLLWSFSHSSVGLFCRPLVISSGRRPGTFARRRPLPVESPSEREPAAGAGSPFSPAAFRLPVQAQETGISRSDGKAAEATCPAGRRAQQVPDEPLAPRAVSGSFPQPAREGRILAQRCPSRPSETSGCGLRAWRCGKICRRSGFFGGI